MKLFSEVVERLRAVLFRDREERELDEELRFHLEREAEKRAREGSAEPLREARIALGGMDQVKEEVRAARGLAGIEELVADGRYAFRALRRNAGFTASVVAVLGLAIGAATTVFAVVDGVLLTRLPYDRPEQLVRVYQRYGSGAMGTLSVVDVQAILEHQGTLQSFGALRPDVAALGGTGSPELVSIGRVTSGFFEALGVRPAAGRLLGPADDGTAASPVAVVSHALAVRALGGPADAVGRTITLDGLSHTVVGVLEPGRSTLAGFRAEAWPALRLEAPERRGPFGLRAIGRLRVGVTLERAEGDLAELSRGIFPLWASSFQDREATLTPVSLHQSIVGNAGEELGLFGGAVLLVLLVALANVATLQLARASSREHELLLRMSLGARRGRVVRLLVTESLVLTALAGLGALGVAYLGVRLAGAVGPALPRLADVGLDARALAFATVTVLVSALAVSAAPITSLLGARRPLTEGLQASSRRAGHGPRAARLRGALVVAEFALVLPLLLGAGLLFDSFLRMQRVDPGFDPQGVVAVNVALPPARYPGDEEVVRFWRAAEARAAAAPGVEAAGLASFLPPNNFGDVNNFDLLDRPVPPGTSQPVTPWAVVTEGYFEALGVRLLEGRRFTPGDSAGAPPVALVSRTWARTYYPGGSAVGKQLYSGGCTSCPPTTVIGVVGDVLYRGLTGSSDAVYVPVTQAPGRSLNVLARSRAAPAAAFAGLHAAIASLDTELAPLDVVLADRIEGELGDPFRWAAIVGGFATVGALLAALGIFGLMSYTVWLRRRELGVRVALGADPGGITRFVMGRGMRYAAIGTGIGLALAALGKWWLGSLLFGVSATDARAVLAAAATVLGIAAVACLIPGVRAARIRVADVLSGE